MFSVKGKFVCPMLGNNCNFQHSSLQDTNYITYREWFIFQVCLEMVSGVAEGTNSWPFFQFPQWRLWEQIKPKLSWDYTLASLTKEKDTHLMFTRSETTYFNATKLVFVWHTFSWNDPLENSVYKHPRTNSTLPTQAYHQCTAQQVLSASPWPVTAFTKALCSLAISGHFKYFCHEHIAQL